MLPTQLGVLVRLLSDFDVLLIGNAASGNAAAVLQLQAKVPQWLTGHDEVRDTMQR